MCRSYHHLPWVPHAPTVITASGMFDLRARSSNVVGQTVGSSRLASPSLSFESPFLPSSNSHRYPPPHPTPPTLSKRHCLLIIKSFLSLTSFLLVFADVNQAAFVTLLRDTGLGVAMTRGLLSGMCGAMPSWMLDDLVATMRSLFDSLLPAAVTSWVEAVLRDPTFER